MTTITLVGQEFNLSMSVEFNNPTVETVSDLLVKSVEALFDNYDDLIRGKEFLISCEKQQAALFAKLDNRGHKVTYITTTDERMRNTFLFGTRKMK